MHCKKCYLFLFCYDLYNRKIKSVLSFEKDQIKPTKINAIYQENSNLYSATNTIGPDTGLNNHLLVRNVCLKGMSDNVFIYVIIIIL